MSYAIYLDGVKLPVNPETFKEKVSRKVNEIDIVGSGKVTTKETKSLRTFSWDSELPDSNQPEYYINLIEASMNSEQPINLVVSNGSNYNISCLCFIESFEKEETLPGFYAYDISLKEYVKYTIKSEDIPAIVRPAPKLKPVVAISKNASSYNATKSNKGRSVGKKLKPLPNPCVGAVASVIPSSKYYRKAEEGEYSAYRNGNIAIKKVISNTYDEAHEELLRKIKRRSAH